MDAEVEVFRFSSPSLNRSLLHLRPVDRYLILSEMKTVVSSNTVLQMHKLVPISTIRGLKQVGIY